ncbi:Retinoblastoma-binding protein 5 [Porphyridium purpureum]|uniref:Retinoblastoma-binding protein 5 n=1 Tax=Porphyridium purpureum TaxID=35688 RepID=A0A5J4YQU2_PORPP|nr:Retinoblastoma-binding protein 5 [Porphyridium purpureum]|eukprot:POR7428..scf236_6
MNRTVLNSFEQGVPLTIDDYLETAAECLAFSRYGNLLVLGTKHGALEMWDFNTRSRDCVIAAHNKKVSALSLRFPPNGEYVYTASIDGELKLWHTLTQRNVLHVAFHTPILACEAHPRNPDFVLVCTTKHGALLLRITGVPEAASPAARTLHRAPLENGNGLAVQQEQMHQPSVQSLEEMEHQILLVDAQSCTCATFSPDGRYVLAGRTDGMVSVFKLGEPTQGAGAQILKHEANFEVPGRASIKSILFEPEGRMFVINSLDRTVRLFSSQMINASTMDQVVSSLEPYLLFTMVDLVNRKQYMHMTFSPDGDYLVLTLKEESNKLNIHRTSDGLVEKVLEGPGEMVGGVAWHPFRALIASLGGNFGGVYVWTQSSEEHWYAFAPEFRDVQENVLLSETESEWDWIVEKAVKRERDGHAEIMEIEPNSTLYDLDPSCPYFFLPVTEAPASDEYRHENKPDNVEGMHVRDEAPDLRDRRWRDDKRNES